MLPGHHDVRTAHTALPCRAAQRPSHARSPASLRAPLLPAPPGRWGEQNTEAEAHAQLSRALELGVNFIDVAELYPVPPKASTFGVTERIVGSWLKADPSRRDKVVIATKVTSRSAGARLAHIVGSRAYPEGTPPQTELALTRPQILAACEGSLERLGIDCIDLYQIHWPDRATNIFDTRAYKRSAERPVFTPFDETVGAVGELLRRGLIKQWGLSNENSMGVCKMLESCARLGVQRPVSIQNDFSLLHRKFEEDGTAEACSPLHSGVAPHGVLLLAYGALAGGTLSGKYRRGSDGSLQTSAKGARHTLFPAFQPRYFSGAVRARTRGRRALTPPRAPLTRSPSRRSRAPPVDRDHRAPLRARSKVWAHALAARARLGGGSGLPRLGDHRRDQPAAARGEHRRLLAAAAQRGAGGRDRRRVLGHVHALLLARGRVRARD